MRPKLSPGAIARRVALATIPLFSCAWLVLSQTSHVDEARLWHYRNLGKAFYENPMTQKQAVEEFRKALELEPNSAREETNYGLALLRAGETTAGMAALDKARAMDPNLPHPWFNLGIALKREGDLDTALARFRTMERLVPTEPVTHYQIGTILKANGDAAGAVAEFEKARDLNPRLAAPHFQLYGMYRQMNLTDRAAEELRIFQELKAAQTDAVIPEDMEWCVYSEIYDPPPGSEHPIPAPAAPVYRAERLAAGFAGDGPGVTALLLDGSHPGLIAWSAARTVVYREGRVAVTDSGLEGLRDVVFIAPGDFDNDGLPDLCVITKSGASLYHNVNGKFRKQADLAQGSFRQAVWLDYDHDYDLDVFLLGDDSRLMRNNGQAGFSDETARFPFVKGRALSATPFDLEPDTPGFDLVVSYADRPGALYRDQLVGKFTATDLVELPAGAFGLMTEDFDRDTRTDLEAQTAGGRRIRLRNLPGRFEAADEPQGPRGMNPALRQAYFFEGRGRLSRAYINAEGSLMLDRDVTPNAGHWMEVALTGVKNLKTAIGSKVEVKAGTLYSKQTYEGMPLLFRLGGQPEVETVRITWPNGLIQNETDPPVDRMTAVKEAPRLAGSCPMIFTWNGERFTFLTDVLGVAPLGASSGDGQFFPVDHQEWVSIPGETLQARDGAYEVRVTEELREVSYIDQIQLQALDHPAATEIVSNEKFKSPPFPEFRLFGVGRRIYPVGARDQKGNDVRAALLATDGAYPDSFRRNQAGVAELHNLDLDFGTAAASNHAVLILHGWVDWADGSTFLGAMQEHRDLTFPYLQVKDGAGKWRTVVEDMGMPSGKPKTMAVDLSGKFLSASREVRIVTNLCVYWDEIYLAEDDTPPQARLTTIPIREADLGFRGFSRTTPQPDRLQPETVDYQKVSSTAMWNPTAGNYTRYGPVEALLEKPDDRMVIMGSGDEIKLRFRADMLPALPAGWKRDFLLLVDGWAKDADANTAFSQTVLPLPFHGMTSYPYPAGERYPNDKVHQDYQKEYNTRPALRLIRPLTEGMVH